MNRAVACWREVRSKTSRQWLELVTGVGKVTDGGGEVMTPVYVGECDEV